MTTSHQVGEKVRITVEGVITEVDGEHGEHIEIMYAFTERLKGTLGVLPEALAVKIESLEDGASAAEKPLTLGDVWKDRDGDTWRVINNGEVILTSDGTNGEVRKTWAHVNARYSPLTFVRHTEPAPVDTVPVLRLGDRWEDCDGDTWHVERIADGSIGLAYGGMERSWAGANANYGPLTPAGTAS